jgi:DNA-binding beta-propeller fold protein YncE
MNAISFILTAVAVISTASKAAPPRLIYVTSFESDSVLKFDADTGMFAGVFVPSGSGGLNGPTGLTFGPDGHLYVSSFVFSDRVLKYHGRTGAFLGEFVTQNSGGLRGPMDLAFEGGNLYVVSSYEGGVFRFNGRTGAPVDRFTALPSGAEAIAFRGAHMYVSSHMTDSVHKFNKQTGTHLGSFTEAFPDWATGFAFGPDGNVYVASFFDDSVMKFNSQTGQWMGTFASNCFGPQMILFGSDGDLYVASYHGDSIDRFDGVTGAWKSSMWGHGLDGPIDIAFKSTSSFGLKQAQQALFEILPIGRR